MDGACGDGWFDEADWGYFLDQPFDLAKARL
jgi:hypothetical protein